MPGIEAADFDCPGCGGCWTAVSGIRVGSVAQAVVRCPQCGDTLGTVRCDQGHPALRPRPSNQPNVGFVRIYGADRALLHLASQGSQPSRPRPPQLEPSLLNALQALSQGLAADAVPLAGRTPPHEIAPVGFDPTAAKRQP